MDKMYILVNKSGILLGCFSSTEKLNIAIKVLREKEPNSKLYYQSITIDNFDSILFNFWTIHKEKLIEVTDKVN